MLRDTLRRNASRVMNFVKQWDLDGSGEVERWEFRRAIGSMGVIVPSIAMVDDLFDEMDKDKSGALSYDVRPWDSKPRPVHTSLRGARSNPVLAGDPQIYTLWREWGTAGRGGPLAAGLKSRHRPSFASGIAIAACSTAKRAD